jgi:predicted nucleotidyltransferase
VAPLPAQLLLKALAWSERHREDRRDAVDIRTLIDAYAAGWNQEHLYDDGGDLLERFEFDNELAAAALLGRDAFGIAETRTATRVRQILDSEVSEDSSLKLAGDMTGRVEVNLQLLRALRTGFA